MIKDILKRKNPLISFEVFPPKTEEAFSSFYSFLESLSQHKPDFISITYGAGGSTNKKTLDIASYIQNHCHVDALAHLTSCSITEDQLDNFLYDMKQNQINNIFALRGDKPKDMSWEAFSNRHFGYAKDLVEQIKQSTTFTIAGACYPEIHPESPNRQQDLTYLKSKVDAGVDFLITQMFYDNQKFYEFLELADKQQINVPVSAGIMPITTINQVKTIVTLAGIAIPPSVKSLISAYEHNPQDFAKAGIEYATKQVEDLLSHGVAGIHLFTLNKLEASGTILRNLNL